MHRDNYKLTLSYAFRQEPRIVRLPDDRLTGARKLLLRRFEPPEKSLSSNLGVTDWLWQTRQHDRHFVYLGLAYVRAEKSKKSRLAVFWFCRLTHCNRIGCVIRNGAFSTARLPLTTRVTFSWVSRFEGLCIVSRYANEHGRRLE